MPHCCSWGPDTDSSRERDSWCGQAGSAAAGPPACVPGSTDPGLAQTGTPCSWLPPPWQLVALELPAGVGTCGLGGVWSSTVLCPHFCSLQPPPAAAQGRSHLYLLASIPCFSGGKVVSKQVLWETGAPEYLLQRRGLLAGAVPSQLDSKAQLAVLGSVLRSSAKCPGGGQNVLI